MLATIFALYFLVQSIKKKIPCRRTTQALKDKHKLRKGQERHPFLRNVSFYLTKKLNGKKDIADGLTTPFFILGLNEAHLFIKMEGMRPNHKLD
jgi:hypothetical protein